MIVNTVVIKCLTEIGELIHEPNEIDYYSGSDVEVIVDYLDEVSVSYFYLFNGMFTKLFILFLSLSSLQ